MTARARRIAIRPWGSDAAGMEELIRLVSQKTGLPAEASKLAVETVLQFLKTKLPQPIAAQLDSLIAGGGAGGLAGGLGQVGDLAAGLGGMFNKG